MKKTTLLFALALAACFSADAQVTLTGTSYSQNFDLLGSGLPSGWRVYDSSSASFLGLLTSMPTAPGDPSMLRPDTSCAGLVLGGGFKNFPSATVAHPGDNWCAAPPTYSNRALGIRQVSPTNSTHPNLDPGAAFAFEIANTTGFTSFNLAFELQSLDTSSPRVTTWSVDYGFGTSPTSFTAASTGTSIMTTGGNAFGSNVVNVNFGTALDNNAGPVWIRVVALTASSGSGNRPSSAIDSFMLSWTNPSAGVSTVTSTGSMLLKVLGAATSSNINFNCTTEEPGIYTLNLCDMTGRSVYTEQVQLTGGTQTHTVNANVPAGIYVARISNGKTLGIAKVAVQ